MNVKSIPPLNTSTPMSYRMTISRLTVDKLGVKLYDRVSAVIAELIANGYDADATKVTIEAPMGQSLANRTKGIVKDKGYEIVVRDDGVGMTPSQINDFYLKVGAERRKDPQRGDTSPKFKRKVMGRKGVGKLAPFGICTTIEVLSAGGEEIEEAAADGTIVRGFRTAHLVLDKGSILTDTDQEYLPTVGDQDQTLSAATGTTLTLKLFSNRQVPSLEIFERQLAQRFGIASGDWRIELIDNLKTADDPTSRRTVGSFQVEKMPATEIRFERVPGSAGNDASSFRTIAADETQDTEVTPGFTHEGVFYPVTGWMAYAKEPYRDDLMAGVRIYCRGKIAAQTSIFNLKAGFHGEYDIRSYLVGELHADWLDEIDDLIQTDRRDILWSDEVGRDFEDWGQKLVRTLGNRSRQPLKKKTWDRFQEVSKLSERIDAAFPQDDQGEIRSRAQGLAKLIGQTIREEELSDSERVNALVELSLNLAPHITLTEMLKQAAESKDSPLAAVTALLKTARLAELSSFGQIAQERVSVIQRVESLKDDPATLEDALQKLIATAPWLIDPQWSPITANESFATLRSEFQKYFKTKTGEEIVLDPFSDPTKRCDFVLATHEGQIEIVEIKPPSHTYVKEDHERLVRYFDLLTEFLEQPGNEKFKKQFPEFHITLVCNKVSLTGVNRSSFAGLKTQEKLTHITWAVFLLKTRQTHEDFLKEAERQKHHAAKE